MKSNPKVNNLMISTRLVLNLLEGLGKNKTITPIDITNALGLSQRRVYDILAILETASVVSKERKQYYL